MLVLPSQGLLQFSAGMLVKKRQFQPQYWNNGKSVFHPPLLLALPPLKTQKSSNCKFLPLRRGVLSISIFMVLGSGGTRLPFLFYYQPPLPMLASMKKFFQYIQQFRSDFFAVGSAACNFYSKANKCIHNVYTFFIQ